MDARKGSGIMPEEIILPLRIGNSVRNVRFRNTGMDTWTNVDEIHFRAEDIVVGFSADFAPGYLKMKLGTETCPECGSPREPKVLGFTGQHELVECPVCSHQFERLRSHQ